MNGDGQLQENEVITPDGVSAPAGKAENDLDGNVETSEPHSIAIHQSADAYDTIIACGSLQGAQESDGNTIVQLQPVGDSGLFGFSVLTDDNSSVTTYLFQPNTEPIQSSTPASEQAESTGHPVDLHSGVCEDYTAEPESDLGDFQQTNVYAADEQSPGDTEGEVPEEAQDLGPVYKVDNEEVDYGEDTNLTEDGPYVVAVHESADNYETIIACGQVLEVLDDDNTVVFLHPVGGGDQAGYVELNADDGLAKGYLWQTHGYQMQEQATPSPVSAGTPAPVSTPEPEGSPTPPATAVIEETEVVPAATATAMAEGETPAASSEMEPVMVEVGGDSASPVTASPNQTLTLANDSENERTFTVEELELNATVGGGAESELTVPENAEPGTYTYQVLEGDSVIFEGELTIE